mmetsp:Transcript_6623/g.21707  ORF Transcript_6623/g.21707 Transcript_6623/m.21707 type:complete len:213 (+) Transcript_6623:169-807(+)
MSMGWPFWLCCAVAAPSRLCSSSSSVHPSIPSPSSCLQGWSTRARLQLKPPCVVSSQYLLAEIARFTQPGVCFSIAGCLIPWVCPRHSHSELREETGFFGSIISTSPPVALSPGLTDESVRLCVLDVDLDAPENASPKQCLEDGEFIRVRRVPLDQLEQLLATRASDGLVPFCGLQMLVAGFCLGMRTRPQDPRGVDGPGERKSGRDACLAG